MVHKHKSALYFLFKRDFIQILDLTSCIHFPSFSFSPPSSLITLSIGFIQAVSVSGILKPLKPSFCIIAMWPWRETNWLFHKEIELEPRYLQVLCILWISAGKLLYAFCWRERKSGVFRYFCVYISLLTSLCRRGLPVLVPCFEWHLRH